MLAPSGATLQYIRRRKIGSPSSHLKSAYMLPVATNQRLRLQENCFVSNTNDMGIIPHKIEPTALVVRRALETDIDGLMEVQFSAFRNDPYHEALFPGPHDSPLVRKLAGQRTIEDWRNTAVQEIMVCVHAQTGEILGFASWQYHLRERPREEWEKMPSITWAEGKEQKRAKAFLGATARIRMKIWEGRPHIRK